MKISIIKSLLLVCCTLGALFTTSCEDFLDRQEDEKLTFDKIWESGNDTRRYWITTMGFIPHEIRDGWLGDRDPYLGASDEATISFSRDYRKINFGSWSPSAGSIPYENMLGMQKYYKGIRECNIFMQNVDRCSDPKTSKAQLAQWKVQTRFARAYYYFQMMRIYGPVFLVGDELLDFMESSESLYRPRNTWDQCVDYVVNELQGCIDTPAMTDGWPNTNDYGLATKGACQALMARLKLYSARDLFNGNKTYASVLNPVTEAFPDLSGVALFPQQYDANKWLEAANAAKLVLDNTLYKLYRAGNGNPYEDYYGVTQINWNSELIYSSGYCDRGQIGAIITPTALGNYGGAGPTQQQVDAYAMASGYYPISGYKKDGEPIIDPQSGYSEDEFEKTTWNYPAWGGTATYSLEAPNMYKGREPRFYINVFFSGDSWHHGANKTKISFAKGGNSNLTQDYPKAGYLNNRFVNHTIDSKVNGWGSITYPTIRLAEMYLNFIEAVLECKSRNVTLPNGYETLAMSKWDDLRDRAGLDPITDLYPGATTAQLIELCRQERRVELSFENHRFFDTRTWKIAEQVDGGPMYGMNVETPSKGDVTPDEYWKRVVFETRVFKANHYLYPFPQSEMDRNKLLTQNYGW